LHEAFGGATKMYKTLVTN